MRGGPDLSVVLPFRDDEDSIGALVARLGKHLSALGLSHEILAVDEGSGDNSAALLALRREPELTVRVAAEGAGFALGARVARGRTLLLYDVTAGAAPLGALSWARHLVDGDRADVVILPGRFVLCRRTRAWTILGKLRGRGARFERRLARLAAAQGLRVETPAPATRPSFILRLLRA